MKKYWIYILACGLCAGFFSNAQAQINTSKTPDPSASSIDLYLNHTVKKGETYYSISKQYKTTVKELQELNPDLPVLKTGAVIKVKRPVAIPSEQKNNPNATSGNSNTSVGVVGSGSVNPSAKVSAQDSVKRLKDAARVERTNMLLASDLDKAAVVITVQSGETLYSISRKLGVSVDRIKYLNDLESDNLQVGQVLVLPPEARKNANSAGNTGNASNANTGSTGANTATSAGNSDPVESRSADAAPTQKESEKPVIAPNAAIAPNPVILTQKDSIAAVKSGSVKSGVVDAVKNSDGNKRDAGGMPEVATKKKMSLKEYEKTVKFSVGQVGMEPDRHWVLANNHKSGEVVALVNPDTKTIVWCVVMGPAKGKSDSEIIISEALSKKLNIDSKKSKLLFRYAAP